MSLISPNYSVKMNVFLLAATSVFTSFAVWKGVFILYLLDAGLSSGEISILQVALFLMSFFFQIPAGIFADKFGRKKSIFLFIILLLIHTVGMIVTQNFFLLFILFCIYGVAICFESGSSASLLYDYLKIEKCNHLFEYYLSCIRMSSTFSLSMSFLVGGYLYELSGWYIYGVYAICLILSLPFLYFIKEHLPSKIQEDSVVNTSEPAVEKVSVYQFLTNKELRPFIIFLIGDGIFLSSLVPYYIYAQQMFADLNFRGTQIGLMYSVLEILSCVMFFISGKFKIQDNFLRYAFFTMLITGIITSLNLLVIPGLSFILFFIAFTAPDLISVHTATYTHDRLEPSIRVTLLGVENCFSAIMVSLFYLFYGVLNTYFPMAYVIGLSSMFMFMSAIITLGIIIWERKRQNTLNAI